MDKVKLQVSVSGLLARLAQHKDMVCVLVLSNGKWVLGLKPFYQEGISRLLGGGVHVSEDYLQCAVREVCEETGLIVEPAKLIPLVQVDIEATTPKEVGSATCAIFLLETEEKMTAGDDVTSFALLSDDDYLELIHRFNTMPEQSTPGEPLTWADYGKIWGPIHEMAFERAKKVITN